MMRRVFVSVVLLLGMLMQAGCNLSSASQGPMTWIDQPLDGTHFPLGTITLEAHASSEHGVTAIKFYVDDNLLQSPYEPGDRMEEAMIEWTPSTAGSYTISVNAVDGKGDIGEKASVQISVGEVSLTSTPTPASNPIVTGTPTPANLTITPSATVTPAPNGPSLTLTMNANCREGPGKAYPSVDAFVQGQVLSLDGRSEDSSWFWVKKPGGSGHCWVSASVGTSSGDSSGLPLVAAPPLPSTETPPLLPSTATLPPSDTTPPQISNVSVNPGSIEKDGCGSPNTVTLSATVTDPSGVAYVSFHLLGPYPQDTADGSLSPAGGDAYQAVIGPLEDTGNWLIYVGAGDTAGNNTQTGPSTFQVVCMQ